MFPITSLVLFLLIGRTVAEKLSSQYKLCKSCHVYMTAKGGNVSSLLHIVKYARRIDSTFNQKNSSALSHSCSNMREHVWLRGDVFRAAPKIRYSFKVESILHSEIQHPSIFNYHLHLVEISLFRCQKQMSVVTLCTHTNTFEMY